MAPSSSQETAAESKGDTGVCHRSGASLEPSLSAALPGANLVVMDPTPTHTFLPDWAASCILKGKLRSAFWHFQNFVLQLIKQTLTTWEPRS